MAITLEHTYTFITKSLIFFLVLVTAQEQTHFIYNGFKGSINDFHLDGLATILPNGLLQLTNLSMLNTSHFFYTNPITFKPNHLSFSTTFAFAMYAQVANHSGNGIVFAISPSKNLQKTTMTQGYLGLFNTTSNNGLASNHIFAVEFDTIQNVEFKDIDDNHVGIDINSLESIDVASASYYSDQDRVNKSLLINKGEVIRAWIDYDELDMLINVTIAPIRQPKPSKPLLSKHQNLSSVLLDSMYIGFTSSSGLISNHHYVLGWSWSQSGRAQVLDPSKLPSLPKFQTKRLNSNRVIFAVILSVVLLLLLCISIAAWIIRAKRYEELHEPWEKQYAPHRFSFKDLVVATKGFRDSELLGVGGFGKVYRGVLASTGAQVAVKRVSHDSRQGMKEFIAEIASMRRLRHRNLVQLLGYCRRKGELLLVYDYMPYGSLDKYLFSKDKQLFLSWPQRFKIIKGVASALLYLHEEWEQTVLHRDVKASNVLLDAEMNARLGDFGLARLYDHGIDPQTTNLVGTMGYIAPEASRTRKPTTSTDVFAFGMFLFEVGCGRRPIDVQPGGAGDVIVVDWAFDCWKRGSILEVSDPRLEGEFSEEEMVLVLKLGLLCSHPKADSRPKMRQNVQYLNGDVTKLPDIPSDYDPEGNSFLVEGWETPGSLPSSRPFSSGTSSIGPVSSVNSVLQGGR